MIRTKKVMKDLLRFKHDDMDGQDYETAANLIAGNQFIAAANFIDSLDTFPRDEMKIIIMNTCPKVYYEMFNSTLEFYSNENQGTWSEFAEEWLVQ